MKQKKRQKDYKVLSAEQLKKINGGGYTDVKMPDGTIIRIYYELYFRTFEKSNANFNLSK